MIHMGNYALNGTQSLIQMFEWNFLVQHRYNFRTHLDPLTTHIMSIKSTLIAFFGYTSEIMDGPIGPLWSHWEFTFMFPQYKIKIHYLHLLPSKSFDDYYNDVCWFSFFSRLSHIHSSGCRKIETSIYSLGRGLWFMQKCSIKYFSQLHGVIIIKSFIFVVPATA